MMSALAISPSMARTARRNLRGIARVDAPAPTRVDTPTQPRVSLRLTARGRRLLVLIMLCVVAGLVLAGRAAAADGGHPAVVEPYTVSAGDTLWSIAAGVAGANEDVRDVVIELQDLNRMASVDLTAGQQILLPVGR